ncbi:MAG: nucleotide sugar dehydrogenase [Myxococcales bacterium]|nr:nucleotide sugar dehydrogenase [Myxococcales bacterium]
MERIGVVGLGYVGLPVALGFARKYPTVGFDISVKRVEELKRGVDRTREATPGELAETSLMLSSDPEELRGCTFIVVAVPTPIDSHRRPDLGPVESASRTVGRVLSKGAVVVYESTVYPGVTEEVCGPILEHESGLVRGRDFFLGYSPERINPGDKEHRLDTIVKVVSGENPEILDRVAGVYSAIISAGVHRAPTIKVAEAAKVIENTQRDINIALMNELAVIFERLGIETRDVLAAAGTKWNFLRFSPGLVGGHCIGVDPYYLTARAEQAGYYPQVILAGRRINDDMARYVAQRIAKALNLGGRLTRGAKVGVLGLTFKENVPDLRNSKVPDIITELREYGAEVSVHDPHATAAEARHEYGLDLVDEGSLVDLDVLVVAVSHAEFLSEGTAALCSRVRPGGVVFDVKSCMDRALLPAELRYLSL